MHRKVITEKVEKVIFSVLIIIKKLSELEYYPFLDINFLPDKIKICDPDREDIGKRVL